MNPELQYPAISDLRRRAKKRIPHFVFEYLDSGTGNEEQMARNRAALRDIQFMPSILEGSLDCDLSTSFLGREYPLPFGIAPVGMSGIMWPGCEKILARAAVRAGIPYCMSTAATVVPETLAPLIGDQGWFQLYMPCDPAIRSHMMDRAREAGFHTLVLTVDVPVDSRRERQRRADLTIPPKVTPKMLWSMALHPAWTLGTLKEGIPSLKFAESYVTGDHEFNSVGHALHTIKGNPGWDDIKSVRAEWDGPVVVKGVQKVDDAQKLVSLGIDAIWISNHTGRQFDGGPASIGCLPAIRAALPDTPLIYDSGIQGGLDILRAIALGADFVMLGRAFHYAVGALGAKGPAHLAHILAEDMVSCMGQMGARTLEDTANHLIRT
jgi:L-lactate dehydrogenase (cytochrome)